MPHDVPLIAILAVGLGLAVVLGFVAVRLRLPPIVGYLLAGVMIGPATPGFVADTGLAGQLAEIGVMLLMFGVGLHFSLADLGSVKRIAIPGAVAQMALATLLGGAVASLWGWGLGGSLVFGLSLSVASTVVLLRALESKGLLASQNGRIAVGWLVVEDLVMVLALVLLPAAAGLLGAGAGADPVAGASLGWAVAATLGKVAAFVAVMLVVGRRLLPRALRWVARTGSRELFTLAVIAAAVGVAFGAASLFDVSFALGAFFAGLMLRESEYSARAADESLPLRDAFAVLFFVSVGMLFDPAVLWEQPVKVLLAVAIVLLGKTVAAIAIVLLFRYPLNAALTIGASLAQIGEFSFILASLGVALGLLPEEGRSLILATAVISVALNPAMFAAAEPVRRWVLERSALARQLEHRDDALAALPQSTHQRYLDGHVVLAGYGEVGKRVAEALRGRGMAFVVAEESRERVESLRVAGIAAVSGDPSTPELLVQAHVAKAAMLVVTVPDPVQVRRMVEVATALNPGIALVIGGLGEEEATQLRAEAGATVFRSDDALATAMADDVIARLSGGKGS